jgi:hypothetical protein
MSRTVSRSQSAKNQIGRKQFCNGDDRVQYTETNHKDYNDKYEPYENPNHFFGGNSQSCLDRAERIIEQPKEPIKHPIVNLCEPYIETVFFQYDSFPFTNNEMIWNNNKVGRIVNFTYYLDSSMGDSVTVYLEKISANGHIENLLQTPQNGNNYIKGTFNTVTLDFKCNMKIYNDEQIKVRFINASGQDCTIMAKAELKYGEEDFETNNKVRGY